MIRILRVQLCICEHNENRAMGLVINKPIEQLSVGKILQKLKISGHP